MKKTNLKQGTLAWEKARESRIGSSEIFDIVRYYATDEELQNCGISAEAIRAEKPYTTTWALYHKMQNDGIYQRGELPPELAEYGHAVEPYGAAILQTGRKHKLKAGAVYLEDRLIASLDVSGISEDEDMRPFDYGAGEVPSGKKFVCEQKSMMPQVLKNGLPIKYILQAQYQIAMTDADFYILQIMVLQNDTVFERGKITQMSKKKKIEYLQDKISVTQLYFKNNEHLAMLIKTCIKRFFDDVDSCHEPIPYLIHDTQRNILESIRLNTYYNKDLALDYELGEYIDAKANVDAAEDARKAELQRIIETAKKYNASRFKAKDGTTASFSASGAFLIREPKEGYVAKD
ncbi:MAG: hypothetical protein RR234_09000 [Christensenella sp.]